MVSSSSIRILLSLSWLVTNFYNIRIRRLNWYVSCTVIGELYYGALNSHQVDENIKRLVDFIRDAVTIPCDDHTARIYGEIKTDLRKKGRPIPENDIWIAAVARQHSLTLVSRDEHFTNIEQISLVRW